MTTRQVFEITQYDMAPNIGFLLNLADPLIDLTGKPVLFSMADHMTGVVKIAAVPGVLIAATGAHEVGYDWQAGNTDTPGVYDAEFIVGNPAEQETYPNSYYLTIRIKRALVQRP